jgi:cysteine desulfurase
VCGAGGVLIADWAQGAGRLLLPDADMAVISAHKFGGPIGIGALLLRDFALLKPTGGQERGYRGGTENLPGALAMAAALEARSDWMPETAVLRTRLEQGIKAAGGEVIAEAAPRIATIGAYRMPGISSAAQLIRFDAAGFAISAGSACSSGSLRASHVLEAMGHPHPGEVVRVSIGSETTETAIDAFLGAWSAIAETARAA